jgi:hypothetical protein
VNGLLEQHRPLKAQLNQAEPSTTLNGKSQLCCQQYTRDHQNDAERVVGWYFEHGSAAY